MALEEHTRQVEEEIPTANAIVQLEAVVRIRVALEEAIGGRLSMAVKG